eukprot:scaffold38918_cov17-Tisochrysis_lutea.AAC.1
MLAHAQSCQSTCSNLQTHLAVVILLTVLKKLGVRLAQPASPFQLKARSPLRRLPRSSSKW